MAFCGYAICFGLHPQEQAAPFRSGQMRTLEDFEVTQHMDPGGKILAFGPLGHPLEIKEKV